MRGDVLRGGRADRGVRIRRRSRERQTPSGQRHLTSYCEWWSRGNGDLITDAADPFG
jgi:hypothetical protein